MGEYLCNLIASLMSSGKFVLTVSGINKDKQPAVPANTPNIINGKDVPKFVSIKSAWNIKREIGTLPSILY